MQFLRSVPCLVFALILFVPPEKAAAQHKKPDPDAGYIPLVAPVEKSKKKDRDTTETPPLSPEPPAAVTAETSRLTFEVTPLSAKGLLSQQTREALKTLLKSKRERIVKLRVFVAGSGDLRRIADIAGEMFAEKHQPMPALTVAQVGALPLENAQVVMEAIGEDRKVVNPDGLAFLSGQPADSVKESLDKLKTVMAGAGMQPEDALAVTCFVSSLDAQRDTSPALAAAFPTAALDYVQMQRGPVTPLANCEAVARLRSVPAMAVSIVSNSQAVLVASPEVVLTGMQLAFGSQDNEFKLAFERLEKTLEESKSDFHHAVFEHLYITASGLSNHIHAIQAPQFGAGTRPASTMLPFESLPSLDAVFGVDAIAVPSAGDLGK